MYSYSEKSQTALVWDQTSYKELTNGKCRNYSFF
ncbi:hypothetical protein VPHK404_0076 [Vibrio phage K404]